MLPGQGRSALGLPSCRSSFGWMKVERAMLVVYGGLAAMDRDGGFRGIRDDGARRESPRGW